MFDTGPKGTILDIALKVADEQTKEHNSENTPKERTIFVLGSKEVVNITSIYKKLSDFIKKKMLFSG